MERNFLFIFQDAMAEKSSQKSKENVTTGEKFRLAEENRLSYESDKHNLLWPLCISESLSSYYKPP